MFSVCSHLGGEYPILAKGGTPPAKVVTPQPRLVPSAKVSTTPGQGRYPPAKQGTPLAKVGPPPNGLATWRLVCLLHSRRRTFFLLFITAHVSQHTWHVKDVDATNSITLVLIPVSGKTLCIKCENVN